MHPMRIVEIMRISFLVFIAFPLFINAVEMNQEPANSGLLSPINSIEHEFTLSLSPQDKDEIELLFSTFIIKEPFGYVLFGEKPMALSGGFRQQSWESVLLNQDSSTLLWKRWETWKSCSIGLEFPNFLFLEENYSAAPNIGLIILINKKVFIKTVKSHSKRFQEITGRTIDPVKLLIELEEGKTTLQQAINFNEELFGILLGFGERNAALYSRRQKIEGLPVIPYALDHSPSKGFHSIEEEVDCLNKVLQFFSNEDHTLFNVCPVEFVADNKTAETAALSHKYLKARSRLCKLYRGRSYFEVSLKKLLAP